MESLIAVALPFALNAVMGSAKWLGAADMSTAGKRVLLAAFALIGVVASSALTGTEPDAATVSGLLQIVLGAFVAFISAHGTYGLFFKTTN